MTMAPSRFERLLSKDSAFVFASLIGLSLLAWIYLVILSVELVRGDTGLMGMGTMEPAAAIAMVGTMTMGPQPWSLTTFALMLLMWWIMMIGMMVPSATPMILLFDRVQRKNRAAGSAALRTGLFTLGYLLLWLAFSVSATLLQWVLTEEALLSPMMESVSPVLGVAILAAAGLYQLTPLKHACLAHCRSPIGFLSSHWRKGDLGALHMGLDHGIYCVGCCWFLMSLLFVGGVMNLLWVAAIAILVLLEKVLPRGLWLARVSGALMLGFAVIKLIMG